MPALLGVTETSGTRALRFVTVPAFFVALAFCLGVGAAQSLFRPPAWILLAATIGFAAVLLCPRAAQWLSKTALLLAWIAAGMFCATAQPRPAASSALQHALLQWDTPQAITGTVLPSTRPRLPEAGTEPQHATQALDIEIRSIGGVPVFKNATQPILRLTVIESTPVATTPRCGDAISLSTKIHAPPRYFTPGAWNEAEWLAQQGIFAEGSVHQDAVTVAPAQSISLGCRLAAARNHALDRMDALSSRMAQWSQRWQFAALSAQDANLLAAALLGDRTRLDPEDRSAFQRVGAFHLLVVSGLSIALIAAGLWFILRRLRIPAVAATLVTLALLTLYAALTGMGAPVERALLMTALYMLGRLLYRRASPLNTLSVAALVLVCLDPSALLSTSLQMTLLAVVAIAGVASPLLARTTGIWIRASRSLFVPLDASLPPREAQFRVTLRLWGRALSPLLGRRLAFWLPGALVRCVLRLCELAFVSFVLEIALAVPLAVDFHRVVALSVGANLLTVPLLALLLPVALLTLVLACVSIPAALVPAAMTAVLLHIAASAVHRIALLPQAEWRTPPTLPAAIVAAMLCLLLAIVTAHHPRRPLAAASLALLVAVGGFALWPVPLRLHAHALEVTALDVGQGDSLFVASPDGATVLVDAGGPAGPFGNASSGDFYGEEIVSPYLWSRGIRRLDAVALTHAHSDHMGGMPAVLRNFRPRELWIGENPPVAAYLQLLQLAHSLGITVRPLHRGDTFRFGGADVVVLAPARGYKPGESPSNDDSLVLHLAVGSTSVLLEGDAQRESERSMLAAPEDAAWLPSDLLKVGHHGSLSSTSPDFLAAVHPGWAVISAGRHNLYGHPRFPILQRLNQAHARVYRTDLDGASSFLLNGQTVVPIAP